MEFQKIINIAVIAHVDPSVLYSGANENKFGFVVIMSGLKIVKS